MADKRFIYSFAGAAALSLALVGGMHAYRIANPPADHPALKFCSHNTFAILNYTLASLTTLFFASEAG